MNQVATLDNDNEEINQEILRLRGFPANSSKLYSPDLRGSKPEISKALDLSDAKLVPSLIIVRTTFFYQNDRLEKRTDEVIARFYTTKIKPKLIDRVSSQMEAAKQSGFDGSYEILSRRGRPLASVKKTTSKSNEALLILDPRTNPKEAVRIIASYPKGATQILIQSPEQLKAILPIARRMGVEKVFTPEKTLEATKFDKKLTGSIDLVTKMPTIEIKSVRSKVNLPKEENLTYREEINRSNPQLLNAQLSRDQNESIWQEATLPKREIIQSNITLPKVSIPREISHEKVQNQILLERIISSIAADVMAAEESGTAPRESLLNLNRSSEHLRSQLSSKTTEEPARQELSFTTIREGESIPNNSAFKVAAASKDKEDTKKERDDSEKISIIKINPSTATLSSKESREHRAQSAIERLRASRRANTASQSKHKTLAA